ncbi:HD domain-containing protein [Christiangramia forsetii]|uniref:Protein containing HD domain n=2 Tax=Christiangramia forsetii TaxID=411153 RepID=A0M6A9_CHRFK|nr:HD domain-containing protein [Christiangramia forsetii]GGG30954.1 phosphohydrolase [Christiangramia forsetii]CAL68154.1 protein containing HD domain [Christiangramia forsetii KT0803]
MSQNNLIGNTIAFVKKTLEGAEGGHDWFHIQRVLNNSRLIAQGEKADLEIVELGALLHDIADSKFHNGDESVGPRLAVKFLRKQKVTEDTIDHVVKIIQNISFKGGNIDQQFTSPELDIVQDADRLDAIGAIGIARTFNYGGFKGRTLYDPEIEPNLNMTKEEYKASNAPTINHFYEKLLLLKDRMNTQTGRRIAADRHTFMIHYLEQFYAEWNGEK